MTRGVCAVLGAGPGNGAAIARRFAAGGYRVALCARDERRLATLAAEIDGAAPYHYDVREPEAPQRAFAEIRAGLGPVDVLVYNAGAGAFTNIDNATLDEFQAAWEVNARGLFLAVKEVLPDLRAAGGGSIVVIGATASIKGGANFAPFASAKAAQRSLAQSLARHLGPERIHVSYVILDGILNLPRTRQQMADRPAEFFMEPTDVAESVYFLTQQPAQAWTFELDLRPFGERW
ncbi:MAG: SDR family NAD(P)-dependent oxidoreductase [Nitrospirota bacterium]|jgi:NAD(P)-dependent dehydrogenase (short-subunit alcohol dehydrogenase family)